MKPQSASKAIAALGYDLGPQVLAQCRALFAAEQEALARAMPPTAPDCAYGPHQRHRLDLYRNGEASGGELRPVLLFVHGVGFVMGDKGGAGENWSNAHVGRWAARSGMLGAVMNYRLAPDHTWPAGSEDVAAAVDWLRVHAADHGGDPARIVLVGTSAGAIHVAGYLRLRRDHAESGAALGPLRLYRGR